MCDDTELDQIYREANAIAILAGFPDFEAIEHFRREAAQGLINFGGSFGKSLGHALARADVKNAAKIIKTFSSECDEHAQLWRKFTAKKSLEIDQGKDLG